MDRHLMPMAVRLADRVICVSQHTASELTSQCPYAQDKTRVVHEGTTVFSDSTDSLNSLKLAVDLSRPYFLFVGTVEPRKNLGRLIEAYAHLHPEIRQVADLVVIGGKGWGGVNVESLSEQHGIADRVKVLGYVNDQQLSVLYSKALFLAMPSLYEGFGLPLLEAMSWGTPVLTSQISSMPEIAGEAAVFVDPESIESISSGLRKLLVDKALRRLLGEAGRQRVRQFSWDVTAKKTLEVFEQAIELRPKGLTP
jgi:glycosyltransferase involved in cell wall biosynthesis